jgi:hypothetical protein
MGGGAGTPAKRAYRDEMLETARYLSCTAAIAGEAFNIRGVHVLVNLDPQKPNGRLEQFTGRVTRGKFVDRVDVVSIYDMDNPTFANTGRNQIRWFRKQRYLVHTPLQTHVDMKACPTQKLTLDSKSQRSRREWTKDTTRPRNQVENKNKHTGTESPPKRKRQTNLLERLGMCVHST